MLVETKRRLVVLARMALVDAILFVVLVTASYTIPVETMHKAGAQFGDAQWGCLMLNEVGWAGTDASPADEYIEVINLCEEPVSTIGWYLEAVHSSGLVVTASLPIDTIPPVELGVHLYERSDDNTISNVDADGIFGGSGTGGTLQSVLVNSGLESFGLYGPDPDSYHSIAMDGNDWPAGNQLHHGSMQAVNDNGEITWYSSTATFGAKDADGGDVYGTPGEPNSLNPSDPGECGLLPPYWEWDVDVVLYEDMSSRGEITLNVELLGIDDDGAPIETSGQVTIAHFTSNPVNPAGWHPTYSEWEDGTTDSCIDSLEMLRDATENVLNHRPSGVADQHPDWPTYSAWLNAVLQFQKSGLYNANLPVVMRSE